MAKCPKCSAPISLEIEQYGGACPNCFVEIEGSIGEDCLEFEPTGMFTPEQFQSSVQRNDTDHDSDKDEFTEELLTDEVDLDEVLVFEDDITEPLEVTEPIVKATSPSGSEVSTQESTKETTLESFEHDFDDGEFDFDDEPTIALNRSIQTSSIEESSTGEGIVVPDIPVSTPSQIDPPIDLPTEENNLEEFEISNLDSQPTVEENDEGMVFDEDSIEDFLDDHDNDEDGEIKNMGGIGISPISEKNDSSVSDRRSLPKRPRKSLDWKPILATVLVIGVAALAIFPKDEEVIVVQEAPVEEVFVPEIKTGTLDKPEPKMKSKTNSKQPKRTKKSKPAVVEVGGVSTFQTAKPGRISKAPTPTASSTNKSAQLDRDVTKLKKSLRYCHTKALKNDPTVAGKWEVQFRVTSGKASNVRIKAMRSANSEIESCMKTKIQRFGFTDGQTQNFKFRILFER